MKKIFLKTLVIVLVFCFSFLNSNADEKLKSRDTEINIYTGMFDFSDNKQAAGVLGLQHQNDELFRNSFLGKLSPITGGFLTENSAAYLYTGVQAEYNLGFFKINKEASFPKPPPISKIEFKQTSLLNFIINE